MKILVTGGAGFIGSHTAVELLAAGFQPVLLDNFSNSPRSALSELMSLTGRELPIIDGDVRNRRLLDSTFSQHDIRAVIHLAGIKSVAESKTSPLRYYDNNFAGSASLLERMSHHGVRELVFSSSAAVYASSETSLDEDAPTAAENPYARTKLAIEDMLRDLCAADPRWRVSVLRYFNAGGAHASGLIGECVVGVPQNLLPRIAAVAAGAIDQLEVFGDTHPTPDGTCVRDYLHVVDIARAHILAMDRMAGGGGFSLHNLGSGRNHSVLEVVRVFESVSGIDIPHRVVKARTWEAAMVHANPERAWTELGWKAKFGLDRICADLWRRTSKVLPQCTA